MPNSLNCPFCKNRFDENKIDDTDVNKCPTCTARQCRPSEVIDNTKTDYKGGWIRQKPIINTSKPVEVLPREDDGDKKKLTDTPLT